MALNEGRRLVVFFSRGKGRGHAVPDAEVVRELLALEPHLELSLVSYDQGAATLRSLGHEVVDLNLPEDNPIWETLVRVGQLLKVLQRRVAETVIVSHEEFCVMPVSKAFGFRTVFLTDWFTSAESEYMRCLRYADEIIFMDDPGIYDEPMYLSGKVSYVGVVLRDLRVRPHDRIERRVAWGLPDDAVVILVAPGGAQMHSETRSPIFDLILEAFGLLKLPNRHLVCVAGRPDREIISGKCGERKDVILLDPHLDFAASLAASNVVVTRGNRITVLESEALGVPSLSISYGQNPIDDCRVSRIRSNTALRARGLRPDVLAMYLQKAIDTRGSLRPKTPEEISSGRRSAAKRLHSILNGSG